MEENIREEQSAPKSINQTVPLEERPVLDQYVTLLVNGDSDAFTSLSQNASLSQPDLAEFLNHPVRKNYVTQKLAYFLDCADVDRLRTLKEVRDLAFSNPHDFLYENETTYTHPLTKEEITEHHIRVKRFSDIHPSKWKGVKSIKFDRLGTPSLQFHSKLEALKLLTKIQDLARRPVAQNPGDKPKGLFHLQHAEVAPTPPETKPDSEPLAKDQVLDAEFTSTDQLAFERIMRAPTIIKNKSPEVQREDIDRFSPEKMYNTGDSQK